MPHIKRSREDELNHVIMRLAMKLLHLHGTQSRTWVELSRWMAKQPGGIEAYGRIADTLRNEYL